MEHWAMIQFFSLAQVRCFWCSLWFARTQEIWHFVSHILDTSVCVVTRTDSNLRPILMKLPQVLESAFLDNPLTAAVIPVACAPFPTTHCRPTQLYMNVLWYSTLWTAVIFCDLPFLEGVSVCLIDNCQVKSLLHHYSNMNWTWH